MFTAVFSVFCLYSLKCESVFEKNIQFSAAPCLKKVLYIYIVSTMRPGLCELFSLLEHNDEAPIPDEGELFAGSAAAPARGCEPSTAYKQEDIELISGTRSLEGPQLRLFELSVNAFDAFVYSWMSELPIEREILCFGRRVFAAKDRQAADRAATDRGNTGTDTVLKAANKVYHEINRLQGLLRFTPNQEGMYIAPCSPDHFILPALGEHFTRRFGQWPWAIVDEKREICLFCLPPQGAILRCINPPAAAGRDEWEELWRLYHKTINNESRKNPGLQMQLMPKRYWKYLTEL